MFLAAARAMPTLAAVPCGCSRNADARSRSSRLLAQWLAAEEDSKCTAVYAALDYGVFHG